MPIRLLNRSIDAANGGKGCALSIHSDSGIPASSNSASYSHASTRLRHTYLLLSAKCCRETGGPQTLKGKGEQQQQYSPVLPSIGGGRPFTIPAAAKTITLHVVQQKGKIKKSTNTIPHTRRSPRHPRRHSSGLSSSSYFRLPTPHPHFRRPHLQSFPALFLRS